MKRSTDNAIEADSLGRTDSLKRSTDNAIEADSLGQTDTLKRSTDNAIEADSLGRTGSLKRLTDNVIEAGSLCDTGCLDSTASRASSRSVWIRLAGTSSYDLEDVEAQVILTQLIHKLPAFRMA